MFYGVQIMMLDCHNQPEVVGRCGGSMEAIK